MSFMREFAESFTIMMIISLIILAAREMDTFFFGSGRRRK